MKSIMKRTASVVLAGALLAGSGAAAGFLTAGNHMVNGKAAVQISQTMNAYASPKGQKAKKKAAKKLIGKKVTRSYVTKKVGKPNHFVMSNAGCERGVYAGNFYYKTFTIHTRTYNMGKTFTVVSVN